jgi:hypothetical protein
VGTDLVYFDDCKVYCLIGNMMNFFTAPTSYQKTILSDLQGAWESLRTTVVEHAGFAHWDNILFHIDEAMSWETVRRLERMSPLVLLIRNIAVQGNAPEEIIEHIDAIDDLLKEVYQTLKHGNAL